MTITREEFAHTINGVSGRMFDATVGGRNYHEGTFTSQRWVSDRRKVKGTNEYIRVRIRFDDECRNGRNSFSIVCDIYERRGNRFIDIGGGAAHDDIAKTFPELSGLIKWHLTSSDGPMHYINNTVYHASNRDHYGCLRGEPRAWETMLSFGGNPIKHKLKKPFIKFLQDDASGYDFEVLAIDHEDKTGYQFAPKYTFSGYASEWYECPFDSESDALDFLYALHNCSPHFVKEPTLFGEGKERDFDAARASGVWPDATDEQLSMESEDLKALLMERLPSLLDEFKTDVTACGFLWSPEDATR